MLVTLLTISLGPFYVKAQKACGMNGMVCYGAPERCADVDPSSCDVLAKVSPSPESSSFVRIEIKTNPNGPSKQPNTDRWVGVGFFRVWRHGKITCSCLRQSKWSSGG